MARSGSPGQGEVFLSYAAIVDRLDDAAKQLPGASVLHRGGLAILKVGTASASDVNQGRREIWLQGGLHACEWVGPVVVLRLMDELIRSSELRARATWYLLPVVDAHGYQRTWAGERFLRTTENGENPNLNFPYRWGEAPRLLRRLLGRRLHGWMGAHPASAGCVKSLEIGCTHSYAVELPPSLPRGGVLGATLLGALTGDPKRWWKEGQAPSADVGIAAGDEMAAALSALVDHLF